MSGLLITILVLVVILLVVVPVLLLINGRQRKILLQFLMTVFRFGRRNMMRETKGLAEQMSDTLLRLSNDRVGALISIERSSPLEEYRQVGFEIDCAFSQELIFTVFYNKQSPLHDGAVVVKAGRIVAISSYLPTTKQNLDVKYGARHRAAVGLSEVTDALTFIVSETSGQISLARNGKLAPLPSTANELRATIVANLLETRNS